jgi:hypothetical protein
MFRNDRGRFRRLAAAVALTGCVLALPARATIVGLNQIVTLDIQTAGVLSLSAQAEHPALGNSQQVQFELGLLPRLEVGWFLGLKPTEGLFSAELNLVQRGPHLLTVGVVNWSTLGGAAQPLVEYGYYADKDHFVAGAIRVGGHTELLLGYRRQLTDSVAFSTDFQSGPDNSTTVGLSCNLTPNLSVNPALYWTNASRHHLFGYLVVTYNLAVWK